ncbi:hypothetical protein [Natronobacterium lacisalsi]|uniref:hypothetical protein n=1 Tax=Natronobacterium lacisalsi TaxID=229731 RepID=UPI00135F1B2B|nr:hypothetical protein [Halobiforma lacisalsi]
MTLDVPVSEPPDLSNSSETWATKAGFDALWPPEDATATCTTPSTTKRRRATSNSRS